MSPDGAKMPAAALTNDMVIFYAPREIYTDNVTMMGHQRSPRKAFASLGRIHRRRVTCEKCQLICQRRLPLSRSKPDIFQLYIMIAGTASRTYLNKCDHAGREPLNAAAMSEPTPIQVTAPSPYLNLLPRSGPRLTLRVHPAKRQPDVRHPIFRSAGFDDGLAHPAGQPNAISWPRRSRTHGGSISMSVCPRLVVPTRFRMQFPT